MKVASSRVIAVLDLGGWYCCRLVKALDLSGVDMEKQHFAAVGRGLKGANFLSLEELHMDKSGMTNGGLDHIASALELGACPSLLTLNLSNNAFDEGVGEIVSRVMKSRQCQQLQSLGLRWAAFDCFGELEEVASALENGCCPNLKSLELGLDATSDDDMEVFARAMRSGAMRLLERLTLTWKDDTDENVSLKPVLEPIPAGECPNIRILM